MMKIIIIKHFFSVGQTRKAIKKEGKKLLHKLQIQNQFIDLHIRQQISGLFINEKFRAII